MSLKSPKKLLVVAGATAVGKTAMTVKLARHLNCAILSADSRQCYQELGIAVAKPSAEELAAVPHFFINSHSIHKEVTAADYETFGLEVLDQQFSESEYCILSGGSGLYLQALCDGLDEIPQVDPHIKSEVQQQWEERGTEWLAQQVLAVDPDYHKQADLKNHRRLIRALEVFRSTNIPFSQFRKHQPQPRPFEIHRVVLDRPRKELYQRIDLRMDEMIKQGLFEEARALYPFKHLKPLQTVGYQEIFDFMDGHYNQAEAIRLLKRNSRRYAKRQLTWFRKDHRNQWTAADDWEKMLKILAV